MKMFVLRTGLRLRRAMAKTFIEGDYVPIDGGEDLVAFARNHAEGSVVCVVTRSPYQVTQGARATQRGKPAFAVGNVWGDRTIALPRGKWRDALTGETHAAKGDGIPFARLFAQLPVCLLVRTGA